MTDWFGVYRGGWGQDIIPEAYSHPAKINRGLARKIYAYAIERGWLKEGDVCLDPFAGICGFALDAMFHGLHYIGCELEDKFVQLGQQNIDLWNRRYGGGKLRRWGTATILQGDSRRLVEVLEGARAEGLIASPPYSNQTVGSKTYIERMERLCQQPMESLAPRWQREVKKYLRVRRATSHCQITDEGYGTDPAQLGNMPTGEPPSAIVSSPPFGEADKRSRYKAQGGHISDCLTRSYTEELHSADSRNLGNMPTGEPPQAVIGSPPYANRRPEASGSGVNLEKQYQTYRAQGGGASFEKFCATQKAHSQNYGESDGQLGMMREGDVDAVIASPPWAQAQSGGGIAIEGTPAQREECPGGSVATTGYQFQGDDPGQLAALPEDEPPQVDACVSSPPWESSVNVMDESAARRYDGWAKNDDGSNRLSRSFLGDGYGITDGNLGNQQGETFWSAAKTILDQCHAVLAPGGVAIWVLKAFIRGGKIIDFPGQWQSLCESCGFETVEVIRAWLIEDRGAQFALNGDLVEKKVARKSFFRRLYEFKARAAKFWLSVPRSEQATYLWQAHNRLWQEYNKKMGSPKPSNIRPTHARITSAAQGMAYRAAGEPDVKTDTQIDWEIVLVTRKV